MDSSGIAVVDTELGDYCAQKLPVQGSMFITDRYVEQLLTAASDKGSITLCHTRAATSGKIGMSQAHPFYMENNENDRVMVGVHNGTLSGWSHKAGAKNYSVDSEWALNHIYEKGIDAFKDIVGAFVFVWWDSDDKDVLNFALNDQRPMYIGFTKTGGMAFASEAGMLYWLMERNKLQVDGQLLQLSAGSHYRFDINDLRNFSKNPLPAIVYDTSSNYHGTSQRGGYVSWPTVMESVGKVFAAYALASAAPATAASTTPNKEPGRSLVTAEEVQEAKEAGMHACHGKFQPYWDDEIEDIIFGTFYPNDFDEVEAVIRGVSHLKYDVNTKWSVVLLGLIQEDTKYTAICSKPRLKLTQEQAA